MKRCPAPDCKHLNDDTLLDARERPWHEACARRALADHFRTPLDFLKLTDKKVSFTNPERKINVGNTVETISFITPHDFFLQAIEFDDVDLVEIHSLFIENLIAFGCMPGTVIVPADFPYSTVPVGITARMGIKIELNVRSRGATIRDFKCRLIGEHIDLAHPPTREPLLFAGNLYGDVEDRVLSYTIVPVCLSHVETICHDDHVTRNWEIERVEVGGGPGTFYQEIKQIDLNVRLTARRTALPTFTARAGEPVRFVLRNHAPNPPTHGQFRVYGSAVL